MNNNFWGLVAVIKKQWRVIVIITLLTVILFKNIGMIILEPKYEANTKLFIGKEKFINTNKEYNNDEVQMYQNLIKTFSEFIKTKDNIITSIEKLDQDIKIEDVTKSLKVIPVKDSQILEIRYENESQQVAYDILYNITKNFVEESKNLYKNSNVVVIQQVGINDESNKNNDYIIIMIITLLGIFIGIGFTFIKRYFNDKFDTKESIEKELQVLVLGVIPNES